MTDHMIAAVYRGPRDIQICERPVPRPRAGELLLQVLACGVCGTDTHAYHAGHQLMRADTIPGHELAGLVVEAGPGTRTAVGTTVACGATLACGSCAFCRRRQSNLCLKYGAVGLSADGGLAQYCAVPEAICLDTAPYGLRPDTAALAQPASIAVHAVKRGRPAPDMAIAVLGAGGIGALVLTALHTFGYAPTVFDPSTERLDLARVIAPAATARTDASAAGPDAFDLIYEASGTPAGLAQALASLRRGGRLVLIGLQPDVTQVDTRPWVLRELDLLGSQSHTVEQDMADAMRMLAGAGPAIWSAYAPNVLPLDRLVHEGLHAAAAPGTHAGGKILFDPWAPAARCADHSLAPVTA